MTVSSIHGPSSSAATGQRVAWVDQVRGLAMLLIIFFHGETVMGRFVPEVPDALSRVMIGASLHCIPVMMFLSGMLLSGSMRKPAGVFFGGKARAIAWPYLLWTLAFLIVSDQASQKFLLRTPIIPPTYLWFLWFLLAYYVGFWAMDRLRIPLWVPIVVAYLLSWGPDSYRFSRFFFLGVFFAAGHAYTLYGERLPVLGHRRALTAVLGLVAIAGAVLSAIGPTILYEPAFILVPAAAVAFAVLAGPAIGENAAGRALAFVGRDSIVFYVSHFVVIWIVCWTLREVGVALPGVQYPAGVAAAIAVGVGLTRARYRRPAVEALFTFPRPATRRATASGGVPVRAR